MVMEEKLHKMRKDCWKKESWMILEVEAHKLSRMVVEMNMLMVLYKPVVEEAIIFVLAMVTEKHRPHPLILFLHK